MENGKMLQYLKPLALGAVAYLAYRQFSKPSGTAGFGVLGEEGSSYARLEELRKNINAAMDRYMSLQKEAGDLGVKMKDEASGYPEAASAGKIAIRSSVVDMMRSRDKLAVEMGLLGRLLTSLREQIISEAARLKSAAVTPIVAMNRQGMGALDGPGTLPVPTSPFEKSDKRRAFEAAKKDLIKARNELAKIKREAFQRGRR